MHRIVFIVPYFGRFPAYFREWAYTAGYLKNENIDFLIISDIKIEFDLEPNIKVLNISFEEFCRRVQSKFDFKIGLNRPYKICDFKPTLGYVFSDLINDYDFWGNCDIDQVWGSVRSFITDSILDKYDRIQFLGHFILYRNTKNINELFMNKGAIYDYKKVLSDEMHYSFCEHSGMMKIVVKNNITNYLKINYADLSPRYTRMFVSRMPNYNYQIMYWENGHVYRSYIDIDGSIKREEFMYFHFQRKNPKSLSVWSTREKPKRFIYKADGFILPEMEEIDDKYIKKYSDFQSNEIDSKEEKQYKIDKINQFIKSPFKKKILWVKQRIATRYVVKQERYFGKNYSNI